MKLTFFKTPAEFRRWLMKHHGTAAELLVGFYKRETGRPSLTWAESVDEALCFGWIDGIRNRVDDRSYSIRFTPRKPTSIWSAVNIRRVQALTEEGRMQPAGLKAFALRRENKSGIYSYEQRKAELDEPYAGLLKKNKAAHAFFTTQSPWYRKTAIWWVVSAKKEETRLKRLAELIDHSANGRTIPQFTRYKSPK